VGLFLPLGLKAFGRNFSPIWEGIKGGENFLNLFRGFKFHLFRKRGDLLWQKIFPSRFRKGVLKGPHFFLGEKAHYSCVLGEGGSPTGRGGGSHPNF